MSLKDWFTRRRLDLDEEDFQEEIRAHLAVAEQERIAAGADRQAARDGARKEFGNVLLTTEAARKVWTPAWLEALRDLVSDARYAIRSLAKNPAFSLTVIAVLTLGVGLNAAVFTMLKSMALSPLSGVARSAQLVEVFAESSTGRALKLSYPEYRYLRDNDEAFSGLFGSVYTIVGLGRGAQSRSLAAEFVTGNYFQVLGVGAERGRTLQPSDEVAAGQHPVVVISDGLWRRDFAAAPDIIGQVIQINNVPLTVVGVADPAYHGTIVSYDIELFIPVMMAPQLGYNFGSQETSPAAILEDPRAAIFIPQGFLRPSVTLQAAAAQADAIWTTLARDRPMGDAAQRLKVVRFWQSPGSAQTYLLPTLLVLAGMGLLVLLIACANLAGLVLVRGVSRSGEIAMRLALGAPRSRIVRLLVVENVLVALPGAVLGVLLASRGLGSLVAYAETLAAPQRLYFNIEVDQLVMGFAAVVTCLCAVVFGLVPALKSARIDLMSAMKAGVTARGAGRGGMRTGLVVAQVAVSMLLLIGAGLVTRSFEAAQRVNPGFEPAHLTSVSLDLKQNGYDAVRGREFYRKLLDAARADAGVESATLATYIPMNLLDTPSQAVVIDGYEPRRGEDLAMLTNTVAPDYFRTLRIGLRAGREFQDRDDEHGAPVAVVNNTLAEKYWGGADSAIGKRLRVGGGDWRTVIGVAADVKYLRVNESPRPYVYLPYLQAYRPTLILHTRGPLDNDVLLDRARAHVVALDSDLPILSAALASDHVKGPLLFYNFAAFMLFIFGSAGMALAAMGTYGLVAYTVKQSTHDIGIRMAIGASRASVVRTFLSRGLRLGAIGSLIGVVAALAITRLMGAVLFEVSATDAAAFARAFGVVLGGVVLATLIPAWRASRIDPLRALRHE